MMKVDFREVRMPKDGLFRAARWRRDVDRFPPPVQSIGPSLGVPGEPLNDGEPRWEDAYGQFATAKFSKTSMAAIGRTLAEYRAYQEAGVGGVLDFFKGFFTHRPDHPDEPVPVPGRIPEDYFGGAHRLHLDHDSDLGFIDVEHPRTRDTLSEALAGPFGAMGITIDEGLSQNQDRRVTRLVMTTLHDICLASGRDQVVGIRYRTPDPEWEAFVMWNPPAPPGIDLPGADISRISRNDEDLIEAAGWLDLTIP